MKKRKRRKKRRLLPSDWLIKKLRGKRILLDCGHYHCQHNLSNTMIITATGETCCHG